MQRPQLEHIIRAAAGITGATEIVIIGSQAVLAQFPDSPADLLASIEADVFTFRNPADADLIEGSIGEGSPFHQTFGSQNGFSALNTFKVIPAASGIDRIRHLALFFCLFSVLTVSLGAGENL